MFHARRHPAESLLETIIAITIIVIATTASLSLIRTAVIGNNVIAEKIIAMNLALEGLEAIRNLRDTNYLMFPSSPDTCWNALHATDISECSSNKMEATPPGSSFAYEFLRDLSPSPGEPFFTWDLSAIDSDDPSTGSGVSLYELTGPFGGSLQLYAQADYSAPGLVTLEDSTFRRYVEINYDDFGGDPATAQALLARVTVEWEIGDQQKSLTLFRTIANIY